MVKNQKKPLVAASRDELLCVALPVIHRLFGVFILQKENQVLGSKFGFLFRLKALRIRDVLLFDQ